MFRKKQKTTPNRRNVRPEQRANVFSYYASRSPAEETGTRHGEAPAKRRALPSKRSLAYIPSFVAVAVLLGCLVYISTLTTNPKVQVLGRQNGKTILGVATYESGIEAILQGAITNRSKLLIDTEQVATDIRSQFPELGEVSVVLPLVGRRPIVQVEPAEPALVLSSLGGTYVIDDRGRAIAEAKEVESSIKDQLPTVQDESGLPLNRGMIVLPEVVVLFTTDVYRQFGAAKANVRSLILPTTPNELHVRLMDEPYYIKFDVRGRGRQQVGTFLAVRDKLRKDRVTPSEYIDVRVAEKAFYK